MAATLDGLITFFASHHAIRADKVLRDAGFATELASGPKELSPNCGTALRFELSRTDDALAVLADRHVQVDEVHPYVPRTDAWDRSGSPVRRAKRLWGRRS
ncbi:MAG: hypothetical protein A2Z12_04800 [Actinobacteria bacterium RBG_16_68_21]|nr:MAG: hypothetical protein A2Z12_04800 [Actinobacteria bacterium RBG_16_68_21]